MLNYFDTVNTGLREVTEPGSGLGYARDESIRACGSLRSAGTAMSRMREAIELLHFRTPPREYVAKWRKPRGWPSGQTAMTEIGGGPKPNDPGCMERLDSVASSLARSLRQIAARRAEMQEYESGRPALWQGVRPGQGSS